MGGAADEPGAPEDRRSPPGRAFAIDVDAGNCVVARGELDLAAVGELRAALRGAIQDGRVVVDLQLATFMDSSAAEVLLDLVTEGTIPVLRAPRPVVSRVLHLLDLGAYVTPTA